MKNGGIIGPKNNTTRISTSGIWGISEQYAINKSNNWPIELQYSYKATGLDINNGPVYTFNNMNLDGSGLVIVTFGSENSGTAISATIDGVVATKVVEAEIGGEAASIWYAEVLNPSSNKITITVTASTAGLRAAAGMYLIPEYNSVEPYYSNSVTANGSNASITASSLANKSIVIASYTEGTPGSVSWSGLNENYDTTTGENNTTFSGASIKTTSEDSIDIVPSYSGTQTTNSLAVAAWK